MKFPSFFKLMSQLCLIIIALLVCLAPRQAKAETFNSNIYTSPASITSSTLSVTAATTYTLDLFSSGAWATTTTLARQLASGSVTLEIVALSDQTTSVTLCTFKAFAAHPTATSLDLTTPAKTGFYLEEGNRVIFRPAGRYLHLKGVVGTSKIHVLKR